MELNIEQVREMSREDCVEYFNAHSATLKIRVIDMNSKDDFKLFLADVERAREREYYYTPLTVADLSMTIFEMEQAAEYNGKIWYMGYPQSDTIKPYSTRTLRTAVYGCFGVNEDGEEPNIDELPNDYFD